MGFLSKVKNIIAGKKSGDEGPDAIAADVRRTQRYGLRSAREMMKMAEKYDKMDAGKVFDKQIAQEKKFALGRAQDRRRRLQEIAAQRGIGASSLVMPEQNRIERDLQENLRGIESSKFGRQMDFDKFRYGMRKDISGFSTMAPVKMRGTKGRRSGGLLKVAAGLAPMAGTIIGAGMGGPMGAQMGSMMGQGVAGGLSSMYGGGAGGASGGAYKMHAGG